MACTVSSVRLSQGTGSYVGRMHIEFSRTVTSYRINVERRTMSIGGSWSNWTPVVYSSSYTSFPNDWTHIYTTQGVVEGIYYQVRIKKTNEGSECWSYSPMFYIWAGVIAPPSAPSSVTAALTTATTMSITWVLPSGQIIDTMIIQRSTNGGTFNTVYNGEYRTSYSQTVANNTSYKYRVSFSNSAGSSGYTESNLIKTTPTQLKIYEIYFDEGSEANKNLIQVFWTLPYNYQNSVDRIKKRMWICSSNTYTEQNLSNTAEYYESTNELEDNNLYRMAFRTEANSGDSLLASVYQVPVSIKTKPNPPKNFNIVKSVENGQQKFEIEWQNDSPVSPSYPYLNFNEMQVKTILDGVDSGWRTISTGYPRTEQVLDYQYSTVYYDTAVGNYYFRIRAAATDLTNSNPSIPIFYSDWLDYLGDFISPTTPLDVSGIGVTRVSDSQIDLTWTNNSTEVRPYTSIEVYRYDSFTAGDYTRLAILDSDAVGYSDTTTVANNSYIYKITVKNSLGESSAYSIEQHTTPAIPASVAVTSQAQALLITWNNQSPNAQRINVEKRTKVGEGAWSSYSSLGYYTKDFNWYATEGVNPVTFKDYDISYDRGNYYQYRIRTESISSETDSTVLYSNWKESNEIEGLYFVEIRNLRDLMNIVNDLSANYILKNNIDLSLYGNWTPIGENVGAFTGIFDGGNFTLTNCTISGARTNAGLFSSTDGAIIRNLSLSNFEISDAVNSGCIAGLGENTTLQEVSIKDSNIEGDYVGGIFGLSLGVSLLDCYCRVAITTNIAGGGLIGFSQTTIYTDSDITNCYSASTLDGTGSKGGLIGLTDEDYETITDSFYDSTLSGTSDTKGTPKTTSQMLQEATFTNWDFTDIWEIDD